MKVYIVVIDDRHLDPEPFPFSTAEAALAAAHDWYEDNLPDDYDPNDPSWEDVGVSDPAPAGYLFVGVYSTEGDDVSVVVRELDGPVKV